MRITISCVVVVVVVVGVGVGLLLSEICVRRFIEGIERLAADLYIELELDRIWPWKIQSLQHEGLRDTKVSQEVARK